MNYCAIFEKRVEIGRPRGLFVVDMVNNHYVLWDHRAKGWVYDGAIVLRFLENPDNIDRFELVSRERAVEIAPSITGESLPDEDTFQWIFQCKGRPPQGDD
jgi:hypothetical protein